MTSRMSIAGAAAVLLAETVLGTGLSADTCSEIYLKLSKGHAFFASDRFEDAAREFRLAIDQFSDPLTLQSANVELGRSYMKLGRREEAILAFQEVLALHDDCEISAGHSRSLSIYQGQALWYLAQALIEAQSYAQALAAIRLREQAYHPLLFCGNAADQQRYEYAFYEGICNEGLRDYTVAVEAYFRAVDAYTADAPVARLIDLYEAAGQTDDLLSILEDMDRRDRVAILKSCREHPMPDCLEGPDYYTSRRFRRILQIHDLEKTRDWDGLVDLLDCSDRDERPPGALGCDLVEAAKMLARHPRQALPVLRARLESGRSGEVGRILYAVGLCGGPTSVDMLMRFARRQDEPMVTLHALHALMMAGKEGRRALDSLLPGPWGLGPTRDPATYARLNHVWLRYMNLEDYHFPPIPRRLLLPKHR